MLLESPGLCQALLFLSMCKLSIGILVDSRVYRKAYTNGLFTEGVALKRSREANSIQSCARLCHWLHGQSFNFGSPSAKMKGSCHVFENVAPNITTQHFAVATNFSYYEVFYSKEDANYHPCLSGSWCGGNGQNCMQAFRRVVYKDSAYKFAYQLVCYKLHISQVTWEKAKAQCWAAGTGAKLVEPRDAVQNAFLTNFLKDMSYSGVIWLGAGGYNLKLHWQDGSDLTYAYWNKDDPSGRSATNCVVFSVTHNNTWKDRACNNVYDFVCEHPSTIFV